jgi:hypothetical protein
MAHVSKNTLTAPGKYSSNIEKCLDGCKEKFNQILSGVLNGGNQSGCGTFLDILTSRIISVIREICHADQE